MTAEPPEIGPWLAWLILMVTYVLPLLHVVTARSGGAWQAPPGSGCPFGPRLGWLVMVLLLGPIGWLLFVRRQRHSPPRC
ncbi:hypothetical protein EJ903_10415 [Azospirillum griseum]|uniref:Uncharacterized protein n=1 Tax=Azospirillum griseum TaxID=2496639 RepID=A0A3S0I146_9PROT|nr:hypothetical protein EJ903_10415 [Azospirillum griseum]